MPYSREDQKMMDHIRWKLKNNKWIWPGEAARAIRFLLGQVEYWMDFAAKKARTGTDNRVKESGK